MINTINFMYTVDNISILSVTWYMVNYEYIKIPMSTSNLQFVL